MFKKFINIIPYLALAYFAFARLFLISENISFDFDNFSQKIFAISSENTGLEEDKTSEETKILAAFFTFFSDVLLFLALIFVINSAIFALIFVFLTKIKLSRRRFSYSTRAPPCFS